MGRCAPLAVLAIALFPALLTAAESNGRPQTGSDPEGISAAPSNSEARPAADGGEPQPDGAEVQVPVLTEGSSDARTALNLLGEVDSASGESRRNENVQITLSDNNVEKELNTRMGTTATIVREFEVEKGYFGAEFGGAGSQQIHLTDRGTSGFHGSLYETHGNSLFSARSFFQVGDVQPARENDYGFTVAVPVWKGGDFSAYGSQQRLRGNVNGNILVPTPEERTPLATDPELRQFVETILDSFPDIAPNRTDINRRALNTNARQEIDNDTIGARIDQALGDFDRLALSYRFKVQKVQAFQLVKGQNPDTTTRSHEARITWNRTWSATTMSNFSVGFNRATSLIVPDETSIGPLIWTGRQLQTLGGSSSLPFDRAQNSFRYAGLVRHVGNSHLLTAGFTLRRGQVNGVEGSRHLGLLSFRSDFLDEMGNQRDTITNLRLGTPSNYLQGIGNTHRGFRDWRMQYFVGDKWRIGGNLTLDYGLSYQPATRPTEVNGLTNIPYSCDCNNFAPRFGFAYRMGSWGGVLRGAYGLQYGEIFVATYSQARFNPPGNRTLSINAPDLRDPLAGAELNDRSNVFEISPDLVAPYSHQYNFSWELTPTRDLTVQLGYVGSRSHRLLSAWLFNRARQIPGVPLTTSTINERRPDQRFFERRQILNGSRGYYDAAKASLNLRVWHGLSVDMSYWYSKAIDLGANYASTGSNRDSFRARAQTESDVHGDVKGRSDFDQPHASRWRLTYQTPQIHSGRGFLNTAFGQWQLFSVVLLKAGTPFEVTSGSDGPGFGNVDGVSGDRPHLLDASILGRSVDHPDTAPLQLPKSGFAFIQPGGAAGTLGRNVFRKDGIRNVNFSISRNWKIASENTLTFRAESINFLNTAQFAGPGAELTAENFGEITNTLNDGRSFRFLLRFSF